MPRLAILPLLLLLAVLQGLAPLLHDHLGGPQASDGIHAHFGIDANAAAPVADQQQASCEEFPDVGVGTLYERRIHLGVPTAQAVLPAPPVAHRAVADIPAIRVAQLVAAAPPPTAPRSLPPPALAPPRLPA